MTDLQHDQLITMTEARAAVPAIAAEVTGSSWRRPDLSTLHRWALDGRTVRGRLVKLWSVRIGGRRLTRRSAIAAFIRALSPDLDRPPASRTAASQAAGDELERRWRGRCRGSPAAATTETG
jgi:hypothetical protein